MNFDYKLSSPEWEYVRDIGRERQRVALDKGRKDRHGFTGNGYDTHVDGCATEYVASVFSGQPWHALLEDIYVDGVRSADVGADIEVRGTRLLAGRLIVHKEDYAHRRFILGIVTTAHVSLVGWTFGHIAQDERFWWTPPPKPGKDPRPAYFVGRAFLYDMEIFEK